MLDLFLEMVLLDHAVAVTVWVQSNYIQLFQKKTAFSRSEATAMLNRRGRTCKSRRTTMERVLDAVFGRYAKREKGNGFRTWLSYCRWMKFIGNTKLLSPRQFHPCPCLMFL